MTCRHLLLPQSYHIAITVMSTSHLSFDDSAHMAHRERYHFDLAGYPLSHRPVSPVSFASQHSLAAYMQDVLQAQPSYPISAPSTFTQYWGDGHSVLTNPFLDNAAMGLPEQRLSIHEPLPTRPISPGLLYRSTLPWNEPEHQSHPYLGSVSESAPSTFNNFHNVYAPQSITYPAYPASTSVEPRSSSSGRPWEMGAMAGSLDVTTGVYQRVPDHPRVRTAQACEKCRIRKAKCTGETPCQRCHTRGLTCVYAAERKMRGPNKVKRKSVVDAASARRASIVSTGSSSDDQSVVRGSSRSSKRTSTLSIPTAGTSSSGSRSPAHSSDGNSDSGSPHPRRARPPPLDLSQTNVYDVESQIALSGMTNQLADEERGQSKETAARRNSLPPYLLESYSRVALTARPSSASPPQEATPRASDMSEPFSKISHPLFSSKPSGSNTYSHSRSSSGTSVSSMPITPIHAPVHSGMFSSELMYHQDLQTPNSQLLADLASGSPFGSLHQYVNDDWTNFELDSTPTISSSNQDKNLTQVGHEMFQ